MESSVRVMGSPGFTEDVLENFTDVVLSDDEGKSVRSSSVLFSIASEKFNDIVSTIFDSEHEVHLILCGYSTGTVKYVHEFIHKGCITLTCRKEDLATVVSELKDDFSDLGIKTNKELWTFDLQENCEVKERPTGIEPCDMELKEECESKGEANDSDNDPSARPSEDVNMAETEDSNPDINEENFTELSSLKKLSLGRNNMVGPDGMFLPTAFYRFNEQDPKRSEYVCPFCETDLSKVKNFDAHMMHFHRRYYHMIPKKYSCKICNRQFGTVRKLAVHTSLRACKNISKLASSIAPLSGSVFENPENFIHIKEVKRGCGRQTYFCPLCKESIGNWENWKNHIKRLHEEHLSCLAKRYKCNGCSKLFTAGHYLRHVKGMTCDRPSFCEKCGKSFRNMDSLRAHMNYIHSEVRLKCDKCNAVLKNEDKLRRHMRTEHVPPVPCEICGLTFKVHYLKKHVLNMHTEDKDKPFQCPICGRGFGRKGHFDTHVRDHRNEKPFKCFFCDYASSSMTNKILHMKNVHKEQYLEHKEQQAKKKLALSIDA